MQRLMAQEPARMVFTDPPYNVKIDGHVGGADKIKHREFAMASGEMSQDQFTRFLTEILGNLADASCDGSIPLRRHGLAAYERADGRGRQGL